MSLCVVLRMFRDCCPSRFHHFPAKLGGFLFEHRERGFGVVLQHGARRTPARQRPKSVIETLALSLRDDLAFRFRRICTTSGVVTRRCTTSRLMQRRGRCIFNRSFRVGVHGLKRCAENAIAAILPIIDQSRAACDRVSGQFPAVWRVASCPFHSRPEVLQVFWLFDGSCRYSRRTFFLVS
jgi:hypothetical protein